MNAQSGLIALLTAAAACAGRTGIPGASALPAEIVGAFVDDYGARYAISTAEWLQLPGTRYRIVRWNVAERYLIAQNDSGNTSAPARWTRIDWLRLSGMPPYTWAFCYSAYDAATAAGAESSAVARRDTPRTGCNGFPFSRMRPAPAR